MNRRGKPPTMIDVAKAAGVSPMTVSRAFKKNGSVSAPTRKTILRAVEKLGYVPDSSAAGLSSRKTGFIAVIIPSINNANFAETVRGMTERLRDSELQILLGYTNYSVEEEERLVAQFLRRRPEAIVLTGGAHTKRCRKMLGSAAVPVIETWDLPAKPLGHVVGFSNAEAAKLMVGHFAERGYEKIGFIGGDASRDSRGLDRRRGFVAALRERGLDETRLVASGPPPISMREGAASMRAMLARWPDTQAVMCVSDLSAFGALTECQRMGLRIPGEIAIAGFGAYDVAEHAVPSITTIDAFAAEIGKQTADIVLGLLSGGGAAEIPRIAQIAPRLIVRQTS